MALGAGFQDQICSPLPGRGLPPTYVSSTSTLPKSFAREIRITLERLIEYTLLNQVVHRFRRSIMTNGHIGDLAKINSKDCKMIEDLMTKYSKHMHSQPEETPVTPPAPDEIETDLKQLQAWHKEFTDRKIS